MFKSKLDNIYHFINEAIIAAYYCVIFKSLFENEDKMTEQNALICIYLIIGSWVLTTIFCLLNFLTIMRDKIKKCLSKRKVGVKEECNVQKFTLETNEEIRF